MITGETLFFGQKMTKKNHPLGPPVYCLFGQGAVPLGPKSRKMTKKVKNWSKVAEKVEKSRKMAKKLQKSKSSKKVQKAPKTPKIWLIWSILPDFSLILPIHMAYLGLFGPRGHVEADPGQG